MSATMGKFCPVEFGKPTYGSAWNRTAPKRRTAESVQSNSIEGQQGV